MNMGNRHGETREVELTRDCTATMVPWGTTARLEAGSCDHAPAAGEVLHDEALAEGLREALGHGAGDQVDAAAGLHRRHDLHDAGGIALAGRRQGEGEKRHGGEQEADAHRKAPRDGNRGRIRI